MSIPGFPSRTRAAAIVLIMGGTPVAAQQADAVIGRFVVHKSVLTNSCATAPRLLDQAIVVRRGTGPGRFVLDDGNGVFEGSLEADGRFRSEPRTGDMGDGTRLAVGLGGTVSPTRFEATLEAERSGGGASDCRYTIRWAGTPDTEANESARRLAHRLGAWTVTMDMLDAEGRVARTVIGTDTATAFGEGAVLRIVSRFPALGDHSVGWMFRDPADRQFKNVAIDTRGNYWVLQGPLTAFVLESDDHPTPNGHIRLRFTHRDLTADGFVAVGEYSTDGGGTWVPLSRQVFRRQ